MALQLGVIADDFTGATDIAGFLVEAGLRTIQLNQPTEAEVLRGAADSSADAVVIGLKTRSVPAADAVERSVSALRALRSAGAGQFIFKYCSTFDSTPQGNIGPVTDALLAELGLDFTVVVPALPVNGRTVYRGYLFVGAQPLHESGMRDHPVTPMRDSNLMRLMDAQSEGRSVSIPHSVVESGPAAVAEALREARDAGSSYAVLDALEDRHLRTIGEACRDLTLLTGGSGLGSGLAQALSGKAGRQARSGSWRFAPGPGVVLSGSASEMTNRQVAFYREHAAAAALDVERVLTEEDTYLGELLDWILSEVEADSRPDPLVYATAAPDQVKALQDRFGARRVSAAIEDFFGKIAAALLCHGVTRFIIAGGETSGAVTQALGVNGFEVGPQISPGVPWTRSLDGRLGLALKSGNFGDESFFLDAQRIVGDKSS